LGFIVSVNYVFASPDNRYPGVFQAWRRFGGEMTSILLKGQEDKDLN
jgi:hypothetical protein